MAKKNKKEEFATEQFVEKLDKTAFSVEYFVEKYSKPLGIGLGIIIVAVIGYFAYLKMVVEPKSEDAFKEMVQAEHLFDQDSINIALNGSPGSFEGLQQIVTEYGNTDAGNLARFKAASAYYKLGDYVSSIKMLEDFDTSDKVMLAQKYGMIGNALVSSNKLEEGLPYYEKAAKASDVETLQTTYYTKAGKIAMELGKNADALKYFQALEDEYPNANNGEVAKFIERLKYASETAK